MFSNLPDETPYWRSHDLLHNHFQCFVESQETYGRWDGPRDEWGWWEGWDYKTLLLKRDLERALTIYREGDPVDREQEERAWGQLMQDRNAFVKGLKAPKGRFRRETERKIYRRREGVMNCDKLFELKAAEVRV